MHFFEISCIDSVSNMQLYPKNLKWVISSYNRSFLMSMFLFQSTVSPGQCRSCNSTSNKNPASLFQTGLRGDCHVHATPLLTLPVHYRLCRRGFFCLFELLYYSTYREFVKVWKLFHVKQFCRACVSLCYNKMISKSSGTYTVPL